MDPVSYRRFDQLLPWSWHISCKMLTRRLNLVSINQLLKVPRRNTARLQSSFALFSTAVNVPSDKASLAESQPAKNVKVRSENFENIKAELVKTFKTLLDTRKSPKNTTRYSEMYQRQLALEEEQFDLAVQDYVDIQSGLMAMGRGTSLKSVQKTMVSWYEPLCALIEKEVASYTSDQKKIESEV